MAQITFGSRICSTAAVRGRCTDGSVYSGQKAARLMGLLSNVRTGRKLAALSAVGLLGLSRHRRGRGRRGA
jgi:hypothetical protein